MPGELIWGIDLGGTKIECAVLERDTFKVLCRKRLATEREGGYQHILEQIARLVEMLAIEVGTKPEKVGVCSPGVFDPITGLLKNSNTLCLNGKPFKEDLQNRLGLPLALANDANCFALAETHMGIVREVCPDAEIVFGVILGTGVGGGVVINGRILQGHHGIAGEWGHIYLADSGGDCYCGNRGCVETIISGPALEKYYASLSGQPLSLEEIAARENNDEAAKKTIDRLVEMFSKGIIQVVNVLDPDVIVLGGGVGNIAALYERTIPEMEKAIFNDAFRAHLVKPKLGDSAGVFGAAMLNKSGSDPDLVQL